MKRAGEGPQLPLRNRQRFRDGRAATWRMSRCRRVRRPGYQPKVRAAEQGRSVGSVMFMALLGTLPASSVGSHDHSAQRESKRRKRFPFGTRTSPLERGGLAEATARARRVEVPIGEEIRPASSRLKSVYADLKMVTQLDEALLAMSDVKDEHFDYAQSDALYAKAFLNYGIDPKLLTADPDESAARIRARPIRVALATGLDRWARVRRLGEKEGAEAWKPLLAVSRRADPDVWRTELRSAWESNKLETLRRLASSENLAAQPAISLVLLGDAIQSLGSKRKRALSGEESTLSIRGLLDQSSAWLLQLRELKIAEMERRFAISHGRTSPSATESRRPCEFGGCVAASRGPGGGGGGLPPCHRSQVGLRRPLQQPGQYLPGQENDERGYRLLPPVDPYEACSRPHSFQLSLGAQLDDPQDYAAAIDEVKQGLLLPRRSGDAAACSALAWSLTTDSSVRRREPLLAIALAKRAAQEQPDVGVHWMRLGLAYYRAGNWKAAISPLERAITLVGPDAVYERLLLAMAHWQQGEKELARKQFVQGAQAMVNVSAWLERNKSHAQYLSVFRAEAEELLGADEVKAILARSKTALDEARNFAGSKKWSEAAPLYQEALAWRPMDPDVWFEHATVLLLCRNAEGFRQFKDSLAKLAKQPKGKGHPLEPYFRLRIPLLAGLAPVQAAPAVQAANEIWVRTVATQQRGLGVSTPGSLMPQSAIFSQSMKANDRVTDRLVNWPGLRGLSPPRQEW